MELASMFVEASIEAIIERVIAEITRDAPQVWRDLGNGSQKRLKAALARHAESVRAWAAEVSLNDLRRSKPLRDAFVNLDLTLGRRESQRGSATKVSHLVARRDHLVLLGDPGAGKTTSLKRIAQLALQRASRDPSLRLPLLVRCRELDRRDTLAEHLLAELGAAVPIEQGESEKARSRRHLKVLLSILDKSCSVLLVDGLDEAHPAARQFVVSDIGKLCLSLEAARVILTCRSGEFAKEIDRTKVLTIQPLSSQQIEQFATQWLGVSSARRFVAQVRANPYSGTDTRPLTLAHLCAIYERSGSVPEKPKTVYRKIVRLLLEEWDEMRSVKRHTAYAGFAVDRKEEFLESLAFYVSREWHTTVFSHEQLLEAYGAIHEQFGLPAGQARRVVREIESHTGLLVEVANDDFEFAHKSIQEYLSANYLVKLPVVPGRTLFEMPHEAAVATALSSRPTDYMSAVLRKIDHDSYDTFAKFGSPFASRLVVERVDWVPTAKLGGAILELMTRSLYPHGVWLDQDRPNDAFERLLGHPAIGKSIAALIPSSDVSPHGNGEFFAILPRKRDVLADPLFLARAVLPHVVRHLDDEHARKFAR